MHKHTQTHIWMDVYLLIRRLSLSLSLLERIQAPLFLLVVSPVFSFKEPNKKGCFLCLFSTPHLTFLLPPLFFSLSLSLCLSPSSLWCCCCCIGGAPALSICTCFHVPLFRFLLLSTPNPSLPSFCICVRVCVCDGRVPQTV